MNYNSEYRLATKSDILQEETGYAIAQWYKQLHTAGSEYLNENKLKTHLKRESDLLTHENILLLRDKTETQDNSLWKIVLDNIDFIKNKINAMEETITYNDFYWGNLALHRDIHKIKEAIVFDYNLMGIGLRYSDIRNVSNSIEGKAIEAFKEAYGGFNEIEMIIDKPISTLHTLISAFQRKNFPSWGKTLLPAIGNGELERDFKKLLELI